MTAQNVKTTFTKVALPATTLKPSYIDEENGIVFYDAPRKNSAGYTTLKEIANAVYEDIRAEKTNWNQFLHTLGGSWWFATAQIYLIHAQRPGVWECVNGKTSFDNNKWKVKDTAETIMFPVATDAPDDEPQTAIIPLFDITDFIATDENKPVTTWTVTPSDYPAVITALEKEFNFKINHDGTLQNFIEKLLDAMVKKMIENEWDNNYPLALFERYHGGLINKIFNGEEITVDNVIGRDDYVSEPYEREELHKIKSLYDEWQKEYKELRAKGELPDCPTFSDFEEKEGGWTKELKEAQDNWSENDEKNFLEKCKNFIEWTKNDVDDEIEPIRNKAEFLYHSVGYAVLHRLELDASKYAGIYMVWDDYYNEFANQEFVEKKILGITRRFFNTIYDATNSERLASDLAIEKRDELDKYGLKATRKMDTQKRCGYEGSFLSFDWEIPTGFDDTLEDLNA